MTAKDRALDLLADIEAGSVGAGVGYILAYAMEIRQEAEITKDIAYCEEMIKMTEYAAAEWQRRLEQSHHRLALARKGEDE
jgi:hypothetical protein